MALASHAEATGPIVEIESGQIQELRHGGVDCFLNVPFAADTGGANRVLMARLQNGCAALRPMLDGTRLPNWPDQAMAADLMEGLDVMVGHTRDRDHVLCHGPWLPRRLAGPRRSD